MGKVMISLSDKTEKKVRDHIKKEYYNRVGALSIFFEQVLAEHFAKTEKKDQSK